MQLSLTEDAWFSEMVSMATDLSRFGDGRTVYHSMLTLFCDGLGVSGVTAE